MTSLDAESHSFHGEVLRRHMELSLITPRARKSLFELSGGLVGDMIRNASLACAYALRAQEQRVSLAIVEKVWTSAAASWRSANRAQLGKLVKSLDEDPSGKGIGNLAALLKRKVVLEDLAPGRRFAVHPVVRKTLGLGR
jgi:hypothetical protein